MSAPTRPWRKLELENEREAAYVSTIEARRKVRLEYNPADAIRAVERERDDWRKRAEENAAAIEAVARERDEARAERLALGDAVQAATARLAAIRQAPSTTPESCPTCGCRSNQHQCHNAWHKVAQYWFKMGQRAGHTHHQEGEC